MPVVSSTSDVDKPEVDERLYRHVVLDNGIRALLISDAETERAACAVGIGVGSWSDFYAASRGAVDGGPIWGLAHFVEHMVFLGTEKFPEESYYTKFLGKNGGTHNAFTAHEQTQFIFDVNPKALEECLSIFSDFFKKPLFEASCTDRELNAVNSEDQMNQQSDPHRTLQVRTRGAAPAATPCLALRCDCGDTMPGLVCDTSLRCDCGDTMPLLLVPLLLCSCSPHAPSLSLSSLDPAVPGRGGPPVQRVLDGQPEDPQGGDGGARPGPAYAMHGIARGLVRDCAAAAAAAAAAAPAPPAC